MFYFIFIKKLLSRIMKVKRCWVSADRQTVPSLTSKISNEAQTERAIVFRFNFPFKKVYVF